MSDPSSLGGVVVTLAATNLNDVLPLVSVNARPNELLGKSERLAVESGPHGLPLGLNKAEKK